jgi:Tetratricopeptide repeat
MANHPDPNPQPEQPHDAKQQPEQPHDANQKPPPPPDVSSMTGADDLFGKTPTGSDSFIDLGMPGGPADPFSSDPPPEVQDSSDSSIVEWAALVEEAPSSDSGTGADAKVDRPSDLDWAERAALEQTALDQATPKGKPPTDHAVNVAELLADPAEIMADTPSQTGAADGPPVVPIEPPDASMLSDESTEEQESLAADLEVVRQTFNLDELDSKKNLQTPASGGSGVLPPVNLAPEEDVFVEEVDLATQAKGGSGSVSSLSGVDLQQLDSGSFENIVQEEAAGSKSSVDLGSAELPAIGSARKPSAQELDDQPPSGRDLIAEAVESGVDMQQPLMEVVEEMKEPGGEVLEASEVIDDAPSSVVDLGGPVETTSLSRQELDALLASQELGSAADQSMTAGEQEDGSPQEPGKPDPRKTRVSNRSPIRETQLQSEELEEVTAADAAAPDAEEFVEQEVAAPEASDGWGDEATEAVISEAAPEYGDEVQEIVLSENHPTIDSSANLEELAAAAFTSSADSGLLLSNLEAQEKGAVDPEEVQLGESAELETINEAPGGRAMGDEEKPAKPAKSRLPILPFAGGAAAGTLVGVGFCALLYLGGLVGSKPKTTSPPPPQQQQTMAPPPAVVTFDDKQNLLRNGDLDKADLDKIDETKSEQLAARGEFRWLKYLKQQKTANAPIQTDAEPVKQAMDDLSKAAQDANKPAAASALFNLAQIKELANDLPGARQDYQKGAAQFKDDPKLKRMFDAALNRLDSRPGAPAGVGRLLDPQLPLDQQAFALAMLICLQPPITPADNADDEAGYLFWAAVKAARQQKYAEALKALNDARALHDKRRFTQLRKPQNPLSDPTEEIFLRACDELKAYWTMEDKLRSGGYLTAQQTDPVKAVDAALAYGMDQAKSSAALKAQADTLAVEKKNAEVKVADLDKQLKDQQKDAQTKIAVLEKLTEQQKKTEADLTAANAKAAKLTTDLKAANEAAKDIRQVLVKHKLVDDNASTVQVLDGVKRALGLAQSSDPNGMIRQLQKEIGEAKTTLAERWNPQDMLAVWLPVLEDRSQKDLAAKAEQDAKRVLMDPKATPQQKAMAEVLLGLALRNQENYAEAKTKLEEAKKNLGNDPSWLASLDAALKEASNPGAIYLARAETLRNKGDYEQALATLTKAIDALPADKQGDLLAERSLLRLEALRAKMRGTLTADDPAIQAARDDAKKAKEAGSPQGSYAEGRIAEELGQWADAVAAYTEAVEQHPALDARGSRYKVALARALIQSHGKAAPPKGANVGRLPLLDGREEATKALAVLLTLALQPPLLPSASEEQAMKLADEIINAKPGTVPFDVRAQAYVIKGQYTEALKTYAEGLKTQLTPEYADGLMQLIESHPTLKRPESLKIANPLNAEKHYAAGLHWYYDRNYVNAEKEFLDAVRNDALDARYHYFLGLARLAQNKQEGNEDFAQGARLEAQDRPSRAAVSAALERVQGPMRQALNDARNQSR